MALRWYAIERTHGVRPEMRLQKLVLGSEEKGRDEKTRGKDMNSTTASKFV